MAITGEKVRRVGFKAVSLGLIRHNSPEWRYAWSRVAIVSGDSDCAAEHPESHEVWQYTCSVRLRGESGWAHQFRHRHHPTTGKRWLMVIPASEGWTPNDLSAWPDRAA